MIGLCFAASFLTSSPLARPPQGEAVYEEIRFHRVHLKNGNFIDGQLIRDTEQEVELKVRIGEIVIRREMVDRVEFIKIRKLAEPPEKVEKPKTSPTTTPKSTQVTKPVPPKATPSEGTKPAPGVVVSDVPEELRKKVDAILSAETLAVSAEDRSALARRIAAIGPDALPYLNAILDQQKGAAPVDIICPVVAEFKNPASIAPLVGLLRSEETSQRVPAAKALAAMALPECVDPLIAALNDEWIEIPRVAGAGLKEMTLKYPKLDIPRKLAERMPKARGKGFFGTTLGQINNEDSRRVLRDLLRDQDEETVVAALQGYALCATSEDGEDLKEVLGSRFRGARQTVCVILSRIKYKPAVPDLIDKLRDEDPGLASSAHAALRAISGEGFSAEPDTWRNWWENVGNKQ